MFKNHFLVAVRNLFKQRFYSLINIFGLTVGLAATLLIGLFIQDELSYDRFHTNADRIVKANLQYGESAMQAKSTNTSPDILLSVFQQEFPEIVGGVRVFNPSGFRPAVVKLRGEVFEERGFMYADSTFFQFFSFPLIEGDRNKVLEKPNMIVLSRSTALSYFPLHDPVGSEIEVDGRTYLITGIMEDVPSNSTLQPSMVASFSTHPGSKRNTWGSANYYTYLMLAEDASLPALQAKVQPMMQRMELSQPDQGQFFSFQLVPLLDLRLYSPVDSTSDIKYIVIFSAVAILILLIAGINYMNLATARSTGRAKEVGVRKAIGAVRTQLVSQFLVEAIVISILAAVSAAVVATLLLPLFNTLTGKAFAASYIFNSSSLLMLLTIALMIGLLAGLYPAFVLSLFKPSEVLKGEFKSSSKGNWLRQGLVIFQFGISVFLIISTLVVGNQLQHIQSINLGYNKENLMVVPVNRKLIDRAETFKSELLSRTEASSISIAGEAPTNIRGGYSLWAEGMAQDRTIDVTAVAIDDDYLTTLDMELLAGSELVEDDRRNAEEGNYVFIVNEQTLKELEIAVEEAVGKRVAMNGREGVIKGVVRDFHFRPLHQKIAPLVLFPEKYWAYNYALVRVDRVSPDAIEDVQRVWSELAPEMPFSYDFVDETYNRLYESETRLGQVFSVFSTVGIIIASLGLLGLVSFTAVQRAREIGIRKVLGASIPSVMKLMANDFGKLVVIAFIVAAPAAIVVMRQWLQSFEYRTSIGVGPIVIAFLIALGIAILSISYQVIRSATANPINVLKDE